MYSEKDIINLCEAAYQAGYIEGGRYGILPVVSKEDKYHKVYFPLYLEWAHAKSNSLLDDAVKEDFGKYAERRFLNY